MYSFAASPGGYDISWDDEGSEGYSADIYVWAFNTDHVPFYSLDSDLHGDESPETVTPTAGQTIFIIVEGDEQEGTFRLRIQPAL